ncbi:MAG TPA: hypothetical protein HA230_02245 [Candidatus Aenigmarchaeota archaeon]|nr:hypothetical protein [Candidatus Aenigmarchaeota archaeon]
MTELKPGRAKAVLDRSLKKARLARDLGNYLEGWKKKYETYIKGLFEGQGADSYTGNGVSATYRSTPRDAVDPMRVMKNYSPNDLAERGLLSIGKEDFMAAYSLSDEQIKPYLTAGGPAKRLDITVEPPAAGRFKRQLGSIVRSFQTRKPRKKKR